MRLALPDPGPPPICIATVGHSVLETAIHWVQRKLMSNCLSMYYGSKQMLDGVKVDLKW